MGWQILWPFVLGFTLSGVVQAVVSHQEMADSSPTICRPPSQKRWGSAPHRHRVLMRR
jgi:hypothetical protein